MLVRYLLKGMTSYKVTLSRHPSTVRDTNGCSVEEGVASKQEFDRLVQEKMEEGYEETKQSLSRRAFYHGSPGEGKFWIIELEDDAVHLQYGKIASWRYYAGRNSVKDYDTAEEALLDYFKQIDKKLKEGYEEFYPRKTQYSEPPEELFTKPAAGKANAKNTAKAAEPVTTTMLKGEADRREFEFRDGKSDKFWFIELAGAAHTVQFGRIGTQGQTKTKEFESDEAARESYDKLISEKTKKGYVEVTRTTTAAAPPKPAKKVKAPAEAKAAPAPPEPEVVTEVTHDILLDVEDWYRATWRDLAPLPRLEPRPFDLDASAKALGRLATRRYGWEWAWETLDLPAAMAPEEATFWYTAMLRQLQQPVPASTKVRPKQLAKQLAEEGAKLEFDPSSFGKYARDCVGGPPPEIVRCLSSLLLPEELVDSLVEAIEGHQGVYDGNLAAPLLEGLAKYCLPYWTEEERRRIGDHIRKTVQPKHDTSLAGSRPRLEFFVAALVGLHGELDTVVSAWPDDAFVGKYSYWGPQNLIFGLGDARTVEHHIRRLRLSLTNPCQMRAWLAHTECAGLDLIRDAIVKQTNKEEAAQGIEVLALVRDPATVGPMLELKLNSKAARQAREWLDRYVGCGIAGAVEVAGGSGKLAEAAVDYLRDNKLRGRAELIQAALGKVPAEAADKVRREVLEREEKVYTPFDEKATPRWLADALTEAAALKLAKLPQWAQLATLPPVVVGDRRLSDKQMNVLLNTLKHGDLSNPHSLLTVLREKAERGSLAALAWHLFQRWLEDAGPAKEKWAMLSLGFFGNDETALKLTPMIRAWPGESQHPRAVLGLECLRAIGTDTALMQLNGVAQKVKFKGIKQKAMEYMEAIAQDKGLTRAELEDRIVPDCDLNERGTREFDFGPRKFHFVLGPEMKPLVRDEDGKLRNDLPKPAGKDDAKKANAAVADWKLLKKQIREVGKIQAQRLEQAMVIGRTWPVDQFETLLVRHPLMTNLIRLLVWGGLDDKGELLATFRVTEEQEYADDRDEPLTLAKAKALCIVHPLHLSEQQKGRWGEIFGDYEIIPPFPQLGRETYALEKDEHKQQEITRFEELEFPAISLVGTLDRQGWTRGMPLDGGMFVEHTKPFYSADVTAVIQYPGVPVGYMDGWDDQKIESCFFIPGIYRPEYYAEHKNRVQLGKVDPVVISEVLRDLTVLASKAK